LYYYRNRYYSPQTGRFISEDPIGWASGQTNAYAYVGGNPVQFTDPRGTNPLAGVIAGGEAGSVLGPAGTIAGGIIGGIIGGIVVGDIVGPMFNLPDDAAPPRGLPPKGIEPPTDGQCKPGPASRPSERDKGGQSLWDPDGSEWRWFPGDKWHNPHWDHNPHDAPSSPWVNLPHGGLPPVKL